MNVVHPCWSFVCRLLAVMTTFVLVQLGGQAWADGHDAVLLSVTGPETEISFTRADLEAIATETFTTSTIWTEGEQEFTGTPLIDFVQALEVDAGVLQAIAANDYAVEIPLSDAVEGGPIIAFLRNGQPMSLRDQGPLWLVYPYDDNPEYQSEIIYSRSIWQLERIVIQDP
ncbi:hypothetical protein [Nioella aestuarii]|uniref:hypothetical protein n=1 Tax=Nioella aestuarii TaxID=1662864 RepID=UPI003D7F8730